MPQPPALIAITRLRRLVAAMEAGELAAPEDGAWLADGLRRYLGDAPRGLGLELALDLSPAPGGITWWEAERLVARDRLLVGIAERHFPADARPVDALLEAWRRYERARRAVDLDCGESTATARSLQADLFALARLGGPPGRRRLADILKLKAGCDAA